MLQGEQPRLQNELLRNNLQNSKMSLHSFGMIVQGLRDELI